jgi:hypothetical protein
VREVAKVDLGPMALGRQLRLQTILMLEYTEGQFLLPIISRLKFIQAQKVEMEITIQLHLLVLTQVPSAVYLHTHLGLVEVAVQLEGDLLR